MVSLMYLITLLSAFVGVSFAEDVSAGKEHVVDSKWLGGYGMASSYYYYASMGYGLSMSWLNPWANMWGGCYAYSLLGAGFNNMLFAKATDTKASISRRAISLDAEQLFRRDGDDKVTCKSNTGDTHTFSTSECLSAARQLSEKGVSTASSGDCKVALVSPQSRVQPKEVSTSSLEKAARSMLKACSDSKDTHDHPAAAKDADPKQVAMLLSKAS